VRYLGLMSGRFLLGKVCPSQELLAISQNLSHITWPVLAAREAGKLMVLAIHPLLYRRVQEQAVSGDVVPVCWSPTCVEFVLPLSKFCLAPFSFSMHQPSLNFWDSRGQGSGFSY
jgi:hypothetical protein